MYAWLNLKDRKTCGEHVNEKDFRKHKYDVFRLIQIVKTDSVTETEGQVRESVIDFVTALEDENINLQQIGLPFSKEEGIRILKQMYNVL